MWAFLSVLEMARDDRTDVIVKAVAEIELYCAESNNEKVGETLSHALADSGLVFLLKWSLFGYTTLEGDSVPSHLVELKGPPFRNGHTFVG